MWWALSRVKEQQRWVLVGGVSGELMEMEATWRERMQQTVVCCDWVV